MKKTIRKWWVTSLAEIKAHPFIYTVLFFLLSSALFLRVYKVTDLLGFYYDQGRDALVIWNLWHNGKPFLIGPITGLTGIFLGPFFYYLIAPLYLIGSGDPSYPAVFLSFLSVCALGVLYYIGWQIHSRTTGLIAVFISSFSYYMILAGRWLSNPTPILLTSVLLFLCFWKLLTTKNQVWWLLVSLLVGISMHFESASAIFYIPVTGVFLLWMLFESGKNYKHVMSIKTFVFSILIFLLTLMPQIAFNIRHDNILFTNFSKLFIEENGFQLDFWQVLSIRLNYFLQVFSNKIFHGNPSYAYLFTLLSFASILLNRNKLKSQKALGLFLLFLGIPMVGYILFQGNHGNIYDYYMTGYYLPMILLFSLGLGLLIDSKFGKGLILVFIIYFLSMNMPPTTNYLQNGYSIRLGTELSAVNWIFDDAKNNGIQEYNTDVYVPPVIPHVYDYLFLWQGREKCGESLCGNVKDEQLETVYLLYEDDPPHHERLQSWLSRYLENTVTENQQRFGGITVERRKRVQ